MRNTTGRLYSACLAAAALSMSAAVPDLTAPTQEALGASPVNLLRNGSFETGLQNWATVVNGTRIPDNTRVPSMGLRPAQEALSTAPDGQFVYRIDLPTNGACKIAHRQYLLAPGDYTLRGKVLAERGCKVTATLFPRVMTSSELQGRTRTKEQRFAAAATWQSLDVPLTVTAESDLLDLTLEAEGPGILRLDAFQLLSALAEAKPYPAEIGMESAASDGLFMAADAKQVTFRVYSAAGATGDLVYTVEDAWGQTVHRDRVAMRGEAGKVAEHNVALPIPQTGHFRVLAQVQAEGKAASPVSELLFGVIPDRALPSDLTTGQTSPFGCNMTETPAHVGIARKIGMRWVMCAPPTFTKWFAVQPSRDAWIDYQDEVTLLEQAGLHAVGTLADAPYWATSKDPDTAPFGGPWPNNLYPRDWRDWEAYVRHVAREYPRITHWALWNEPDHQAFLERRQDVSWADYYKVLVEKTAPVLREANPQAKLVLGTTTHLNALRPLVANGSYKLGDILAFHSSSWTPDGYTRDTVEELGLLGPGGTGHRLDNATLPLAAEMKAAGLTVPLWNTECHVTGAEIEREYKTQPNPPTRQKTPRMTRLDAASAPVRTTVALWAAGVEKSMIWLLAGPQMGARGRGIRGDCTLLEWDDSPGAGLVSYAVMTKLLEGATFVAWEQQANAELLDAPPFWLFTFTTADHQRLRIVWGQQDALAEIILPVSGKNVRVSDLFGVEIPGAKIKSGIELEKEVVLRVGRSPMYVLDME
jgi:hypothetical protein